VIFVVRYTVPIRYPEVNGTGPLCFPALAIVDERGSFRLFHRYEEHKLFRHPRRRWLPERRDARPSPAAEQRG